AHDVALAPLFFFVTLALLSMTAHAQDAIVIGASADRLGSGNGGSASVLWIHPRTHHTFTAGATVFSLPDTRWAYVTAGLVRPVTARTAITAEANVGGGQDDTDNFRYLVVRGGVTRELLAKQLYAEAEWLQADVARRRNGIARIGATFIPRAPLTLRASVYQSIFGDDDTTFVTARGDYDFGRITAIAGFSAGNATPELLLQRGGETTRVREAFAGVMVNTLTVIVAAGGDRQRVALSWRVALPERSR
ncbi:MAG TPA: hypothetical protein VF883_12060, partial [Thermoanaerobaculia bacterium]